MAGRNNLRESWIKLTVVVWSRSLAAALIVTLFGLAYIAFSYGWHRVLSAVTREDARTYAEDLLLVSSIVAGGYLFGLMLNVFFDLLIRWWRVLRARMRCISTARVGRNHRLERP
jgi:hypothetical protein